jgi:hypothetical protein
LPFQVRKIRVAVSALAFEFFDLALDPFEFVVQIAIFSCETVPRAPGS